MATKAELIKRCEELGIPTEDLANNDQREAAIAAKEAELAALTVKDPDTLEAEKAQAEQDAAAKAKAEQDAADKAAAEAKAKAEQEVADKAAAEEPSYEDAQGRKWKFKPTSPKTINIDGHPMTQQEILENEEVISQLVYGNNSFITQKHD